MQETDTLLANAASHGLRRPRRIGLNVLFLIPGEVGGTETYSTSLVDALSRIDDRNEYFLFVGKEAAQLNWPTNRNFHLVLCPIASARHAARLIWEQCVLPWQVRALHLDLVHSLGYVGPVWLSCKSVVTIHDLNFIAIPESFSILSRSVQELLVKASAKSAARIITVSQFTKTALNTELHVPPEKITVTYEAPKMRAASGAPATSWENARRKYTLRRPYVVAFSSRSPHKNLNRLLRAFKSVLAIRDDAFQLVIVGHHSTAGGSLRQCAADLELTDNEVVFTGYLPDADIVTILSNAEILAFPSLYEGFGLPVLEAMAVGTPVVCSSRGSLPEVVGDAAEQFDPCDVDEMAKTISWVLNDFETRQKMRARGLINVNRFSWDNTAHQTLGIYNDVASIKGQ